MFKHIRSSFRQCLLATGLLVCSYNMETAWAAPLTSADLSIAKKAFLDAKKSRWSAAKKQAKKAKSDLPLKFVTWMQIVDPKKDVSFEDIQAFMRDNPDWPRQTSLKRRAEEAMHEGMSPQEILTWFAGRGEPLTANGHIMQAIALDRLGRTAEAREKVRESWQHVNFGRTQQEQFYRKFKKYLSTQDHINRLDRLLWEGRYYPARRMLKYVNKDWKALAEARLTLRKMRGGVDRAIAKVPKHLKEHPGLQFERMRWRRIKGKDKGAMDILLDIPANAPYPEVWWRQRSVMARIAVREGYYSDAYQMASNHGLTEGASFAEAEWMSGWIKLRFLAEPKDSLAHFKAMYGKVSYPISKSRGAYWIARAYEELNNTKESQKWYQSAAEFKTTYYGQLAAERLGTTSVISVNKRAKPNEQERLLFKQSELVDMVDMLKRADDRDQIRYFIYQLNTMSTTAGWRTLVAELATEAGRPDLAIFVGKRALREGHGVIEAAYPLLDKKLMREGPEKALVHGIVRQESAFYEKAVSRAGARGLMQLMPRTAHDLAKRNNYKYSRTALIENPKLNVHLGSEYLSDLLGDFNGSYILTLSSYNAGPYRTRQWINEFGDPRKDDRDYVVDWVEQIPFSETRNYVQRVLENIQVYRFRLNSNRSGLSLEGDLQRNISE